jgi:hypothetical protein
VKPNVLVASLLRALLRRTRYLDALSIDASDVGVSDKNFGAALRQPIGNVRAGAFPPIAGAPGRCRLQSTRTASTKTAKQAALPSGQAALPSGPAVLPSGCRCGAATPAHGRHDEAAGEKQCADLEQAGNA